MQNSLSIPRSLHSGASESSIHSEHFGDQESGIELSRLSIANALTPPAQPSREGFMLEAAEVNSMSRLESLPDDVHAQVLSLLDVRSLINISLTSKTLLAASRTILNAHAERVTGFSYDELNQAARSISRELTNIRTQLDSLGDDSTNLDHIGEGAANCLTSITKLITLSLLTPFVCCCPCLVCCCCCALLGHDDRIELRNATTKVDFLVAGRSPALQTALRQLNENIAKWNREHPTEAINLGALERYADVSNSDRPRLRLGFDLSHLPNAVKPNMKVTAYRTSFEALLRSLSYEYQRTSGLQRELLVEG